MAARFVTRTRSPRNERALTQVAQRLSQLLLSVHHDRTIPGPRFFDRFSRHEQEADPLVASLHDHFVSTIEEDQRPVFALVRPRPGRAAVDLLRQNALRRRGITKCPRAGEDVGERMIRAVNREPLAAARRYRDIEIARIRGDTVDRALLAPELAHHN